MVLLASGELLHGWPSDKEVWAAFIGNTTEVGEETAISLYIVYEDVYIYIFTCTYYA